MRINADKLFLPSKKRQMGSNVSSTQLSESINDKGEHMKRGKHKFPIQVTFDHAPKNEWLLVSKPHSDYMPSIKTNEQANQRGSDISAQFSEFMNDKGKTLKRGKANFPIQAAFDQALKNESLLVSNQHSNFLPST